MAANPDVSLAEQLERRSRDLSMLLPLILGISSSSPTEEPRSDSDQESEGRSVERVILINPITQGMIVIEGGRSLESLLRDSLSKQGLPPASKASIEAMPTVEITQEDLDKECSICLDGWEIGGQAKQMPCKHMYHADCIEKWLKMHGSCPVCRFEMPNDQEECRKRSRGDREADGEEDEGRERRAERGEIWVTFSFSNSTDSNRDSATTTSTTESESSSDSSLNASSEEGTPNLVKFEFIGQIPRHELINGIPSAVEGFPTSNSQSHMSSPGHVRKRERTLKSASFCNGGPTAKEKL